MEEKLLKTHVKGIYCAQCPEIIISALLQRRGVIDADVEYFKSLVSVKFDPNIVTEEEILAALIEAGYTPFDRKPSLSDMVSARLKHLFDK